MDTIPNLGIFEYVAHIGTGTPWADPFFLALSYGFFYFIIAVVFIRIFYKILHARTIADKKEFFKEGLVFIFSLLVTWIVVTLIKVLVGAPRPFEVIDTVRTLTIPDGNSFPSGHTAIAAAIAGSIRPYHRRAGLLLVLFALLVGASRVYLGVHFPIDVVAGLLVGLVVADIVRRTIDMF